MRVVIQRVSKATLKIDGAMHSEISSGLVVLLGIEHADSQADVDYLVAKLLNLRIFNDTERKMNLSLQEIQGELLIVSQFTLHASTKKGNRPSYIRAARPEHAIPLYEFFVASCRKVLPTQTKTGVFGADMKINLTNVGPVTIILDSKNKEY